MINLKKWWDKLDELDDYMITYHLYMEGKSLKALSLIRNKPYKEIEKDIIFAKIEVNKSKVKEEDHLLKIISLNKDDRLAYLNKLSPIEKEELIDEIYKRYTSFKSSEDRIILIWLIGELRANKLIMHLRMELRSKKVNHRRLACSALGKIRNPISKPWLEYMLGDRNPQVRQYAVNSLAYLGDDKSLKELEKLKKIENKNYVLDSIDRTSRIIRERRKNGKGI